MDKVRMDTRLDHTLEWNQRGGTEFGSSFKIERISRRNSATGSRIERSSRKDSATTSCIGKTDSATSSCIGRRDMVTRRRIRSTDRATRSRIGSTDEESDSPTSRTGRTDSDKKTTDKTTKSNWSWRPAGKGGIRLSAPAMVCICIGRAPESVLEKV